MSSILFGSISTIADTSELQRQAFNQAFADHGLSWNWEREEYAQLLESSGGQDRIAAYARSRGEDVDAEAVHRTKSEIFQRSLAGGVRPREGVAETIHDARDQGLKVALVTTTSAANVTALLQALGPEVTADDFDLVVDVNQVDAPKPDPAAYTFALRSLGQQAGDSIAIEDNLGGVAAAQAAGLTCVAFPNANTAGHDFGRADLRVDTLDAGALLRLATS